MGRARKGNRIEVVGDVAHAHQAYITARTIIENSPRGTVWHKGFLRSVVTA